ncbi:GntR family transcriptional regulator [Saccharopolyspora pogona]|uniref:GntR family transcriptional regulator n=1 Tax=Saccharopolyspora pogona TaxID=333966 RepID=UPI001684E102|nr:GntR family transcriptional regulator [Saccharopolyspora pogona]
MAARHDVAEFYRQRIRDGELKPGDPLPPVRQLADEHEISVYAARSVLSELRIAGYTLTTQRGSFVADRPTGVDSPQDRIRRAIRTGTTGAEREMQDVISAQIVTPTHYEAGHVAEIYDQDPKDQVVRREYTISKAGKVMALHVDWYPTRYAAMVTDLLSTRSTTGGALLTQIETALGQTVVHGRDAVRGRAADQREANALQIPVGTPILAGAHVWTTADDTIVVYGEWCIPPDVEAGWDYDLERS